MPKTKISEFSATPGNNTDIDGINISEGCAPSGINDAIRELMAQLKDFQSGGAGDSMTAVGTLAAKGTSSSGADLQLYEDTDNGTNYVALKAPSSIASNVTWTLPSADGTNGQALITNGSGTLSFSTISASPGGSTTQVQYNNAGAFAGSANMTFDGTSLTLGGNPTLSAGTANGVAYLNGSKVLTTGSALTFNGTSLGVGSSAYGDAGTITASIGVAGSTAGGLQLWASSAQEHYIQWGDSTSGSATYAGAISYSHASDFMRFWTNSTEQMRLTSTGLGIGTSSPAYRLQVETSSATGNIVGYFRQGSGAVAAILSTTDLVGFGNGATSGETRIYADGASGLVTLRTNGTERARITSGGYFKASNNGTYTYTASMHEFRQNAADYVLTLTNSNASPTGLQIYQITDANGTGNNFVDCYAGNTYRFQVRSNGGIANYSGNNVNLSDRREKANFAPAKSYLDTICAIPVQTFNYIDQSEDDPGLTLGVVAQDVQAVAPELVMESNWGTEDNPKMRLSIYQTDLQYALMKCIQELKAQNDDLRARVAQLEAK